MLDDEIYLKYLKEMENDEEKIEFDEWLEMYYEFYDQDGNLLI